MTKNSFQTTAIARKTISVPYRNLLDKGSIYQSDKILDYGCGYGTDLKAINRFGYDITGYDKFNPDFNGKIYINDYNVIVSNYVFNVISDPIEHQELVELLRGSAAQKVFIAVRADHTAVKESWKYNAYMGGYFTNRGSFQRFYNKDKLFQWFGNHTILKVNNSMIQFILE